MADKKIVTHAAAEADAPPLPEGWVLLDDNRPLWHRGGTIWFTRAEMKAWGPAWSHRDRLTPLRPTVTEAEVEKAAAVIFARGDSGETYCNIARDALKAAGVEVIRRMAL